MLSFSFFSGFQGVRQEGETQRAGTKREEEGQALGFRMGPGTQELELRSWTGDDRAVFLWGEYVSHKPLSPSVMVTWALTDGWCMEGMIWSLASLCNSQKPQ